MCLHFSTVFLGINEFHRIPYQKAKRNYCILVQKFAHQMRRGTFRTDHEVLMKLKALVHSPFKCKKHGQSSAPVMILVQ